MWNGTSVQRRICFLQNTPRRLDWLNGWKLLNFLKNKLVYYSQGLAWNKIINWHPCHAVTHLFFVEIHKIERTMLDCCHSTPVFIRFIFWNLKWPLTISWVWEKWSSIIVNKKVCDIEYVWYEVVLKQKNHVSEVIPKIWITFKCWSDHILNLG